MESQQTDPSECRSRISESLHNHTCYVCQTQNYSIAQFEHYSIRCLIDGIVSVPLGSNYKLNIPEGSQVCATCFGKVLDGQIPDLVLEKMYTIECQVCHQKFEDALPITLDQPSSTQGMNCSCFYYPDTNSIVGSWGSKMYDCDNLRIKDGMPREVLDSLKPSDFPICDQCVTKWINDGWLTSPQEEKERKHREFMAFINRPMTVKNINVIWGKEVRK